MRRRRVGRWRAARSARRSPRERLGAWAEAVSLPVLAALLATGLLVLYLWQGTTIRDLHAKRAMARDALTMTQEVNRTLEFQIGQAFSLDQISARARALGMIPPAKIHYVPLQPAPEDR